MSLNDAEAEEGDEGELDRMDYSVMQKHAK